MNLWNILFGHLNEKNSKEALYDRISFAEPNEVIKLSGYSKQVKSVEIIQSARGYIWIMTMKRTPALLSSTEPSITLAGCKRDLLHYITSNKSMFKIID